MFAFVAALNMMSLLISPRVAPSTALPTAQETSLVRAVAHNSDPLAPNSDPRVVHVRFKTLNGGPCSFVHNLSLPDAEAMTFWDVVRKGIKLAAGVKTDKAQKMVQRNAVHVSVMAECASALVTVDPSHTIGQWMQWVRTSRDLTQADAESDAESEAEKSETESETESDAEKGETEGNTEKSETESKAESKAESDRFLTLYVVDISHITMSECAQRNLVDAAQWLRKQAKPLATNLVWDHVCRAAQDGSVEFLEWALRSLRGPRLDNMLLSKKQELAMHAMADGQENVLRWIFRNFTGVTISEEQVVFAAQQHFRKTALKWVFQEANPKWLHFNASAVLGKVAHHAVICAATQGDIAFAEWVLDRTASGTSDLQDRTAFGTDSKDRTAFTSVPKALQDDVRRRLADTNCLAWRAVLSGHLAFAEWSVGPRGRCCTVAGMSAVLFAASARGSVEAARWALSQGAVWPCRPPLDFAKMRWVMERDAAFTDIRDDAHDSGVSFFSDTKFFRQECKGMCVPRNDTFPFHPLRIAAAFGRFDFIKWAVTDGRCTWAPEGFPRNKSPLFHGNFALAAAARDGALDFAQWARAARCEWTVGVVTAAVRGRHLAFARWAVENNCPWDKMAANEFAKQAFPEFANCAVPKVKQGKFWRKQLLEMSLPR